MINKPFHRSLRMASYIKKTICEIVEFEMNDSILKNVIFVDVVLSKDLRYSKVYVHYLLNDISREELMKRLNKASKFIKLRLSKKIKSKYIPELIFVYDETQEKAFKIDNIIKDTKYIDV